MNLLHIAEGWGKAFGWLKVDKETAELSQERLKVCASSGPNGGPCPFARESSFLKLLHGEVKELGAIYCGGCGCPVNEKSLVKDEKCPEGRWPR